MSWKVLLRALQQPALLIGGQRQPVLVELQVLVKA
jgi:hypothetical protein